MIFTHQVRDPAGIHARPAALLSIALSKIGARVKITHQTRTADPRSVIQMLSLGALHGSELQVEVQGTPEQALAVQQEFETHL
ncbi:HPr family phosphocarrier protein [Deinococcus cellulosilyticus]|uniref:HPr domain-containing protein n=1 Tax=Deinococcus cellulosilyticus (strain DSM 18568 / NBRC 106333 / KACC 11606 / 5516J-15) TaxID=1223518 RepID=A0A511MWD1_DEIC1|nr:HPr family phosphocarrier protein [Deinococcus cellulosilyticus]GEM44568.1 hypothetical protein DC3_02030 [Deinococcus cellulosilyticus NBRC 106333 = KACC 11606]